MTASTPTPRITTPFGAESTAAEVISGVDLTGRRAVVTGGASGIGVETARALASAGAQVTLAVRDLTAGARAAADISATTDNRDVHIAPLDLADQSSVAAFVAAWGGPLDILVNNAGVMASRNSARRRAGNSSSPPTTWGTSRWPPDCTERSRRPMAPASWP